MFRSTAEIARLRPRRSRFLMAPDKRREHGVLSRHVRERFTVLRTAPGSRACRPNSTAYYDDNRFGGSASPVRPLARSFRAGDFSQVRDSADSWKQQRGPSVREGGVEGARSLGEINPSKTTRPHCLSSCLVIPGGYRTNGLFQVISRGVVVPSTRRAPSLFLTFSLPSLARFLRSGVTKERTYAERNLTLSFFLFLSPSHSPPFST